MYNAELVRALCHDISVEKDALKAQELVSLLQAVLKDDHEETRVRMAFIAKIYPPDIRGPEPTD
jgi:hypothetical protein